MDHSSPDDIKSVKFESDSNHRVFHTPLTPPKYGVLLRAEAEGNLAITCHICGFKHEIGKPCRSRLKWSPEIFYLKCVVCKGHHPEGRCWFEYLKPFVTSTTFCESCDFTHTGFCKTAIFCTNCNKHHNDDTGCVIRTEIDPSKDICRSCNLTHIYHCPQDLYRIQSDLILWCNLCKLRHKFMHCSPFCRKCFRHHGLNECPPRSSYCTFCNRCHETANDCEKPEKVTKKSKKQKEEKYYSEFP